MPKRSEKRDTAKAEYIAKKKKGEEVSLRALAGELGVSYKTLRNWKRRTSGKKRYQRKSAAGSRATKTARASAMQQAATTVRRPAIRTQRKTERIAPSFLICFLPKN